MRALITGATGFVGPHLIEHLSAAGDSLVGLSDSARWPVDPPSLSRMARLERFNLVDDPEEALVDLLRRKQPEAIYHLAAQSNPQRSVADPRGTWTINLVGTLNLLEAVRAVRGQLPSCQPRVVLVSSGVCYGNPAPEHLPVSEGCPLRPNNPYAASKAAADLLGIQHFLAYGTHVVIARPFNHAGPSQTDDYVLSSLARQVAEVEAGRSDAVAHGNLAVMRDFTDVRDIVRAYRLLAEKGRPGEAYNIGTGRDVPVARMLELLTSMARVPIPTKVDASRMRAVDQPRLLCDASKLRAETGWEPQYTIDQTLEDMINYWRRQITRGTS